MPVPAKVFRVFRGSTPDVSVNFNEKIDFCVWVLELDRLQFPPFEHHTQETGSLQRQGLTPKNWRSWFERVVRSQHSMLNGSGWYQSRFEWVEHQISNCKAMAARLRQFPKWNETEMDWQAMQADWGKCST